MKKEEYYKKYGREEYEVSRDQLTTTEYPKPAHRYTVVYEANNQAVEPTYHFCLNLFRDLGFPVVDKITDLFAASEMSTFYGAAGTKLGASQDKVMSILRLLSELIRSIPVYIREVRWIEERLDFHEKSKKEGKEGFEADVTLKGIFTDLVEGGMKTASSVLGLSSQVQFAALPDLFFTTRKDPEESDEEFAARVDKMKGDYNPQVINLLIRKLNQYYTWKKHNEDELSTRHKYLISYLKQYYSNIKLYMNWVKPYLRVIKRLSMDLNKTSNPEIVAAFEGSMVEIELMAKMIPEGNKDYYSVIILNLQYSTKATLPITSPDYHHRGPIHIGTLTMHWRVYGWTEQDIENYKNLREQEDFDLLLNMDATLMEAMEGVPENIREWLEKRGAIKKDEPEPEGEGEKRSSILDPFVEVWKGLTLPATSVWDSIKSGYTGLKDDLKGKRPGVDPAKMKAEKKKAEGLATKLCFTHYKIFKKSHGMAMW